jgi:hypothetical protein
MTGVDASSQLQSPDGLEDVAAAANDPKLSDGGGWRAGCTAGGKAAAEAASVTAGAVRCSAWLGVAVIC